MPRYYFDIYDGQEWFIHQTGVEIEDLEQAQKGAHAALANIANDELPDGNDLTMAVRVKDESGQVVIETALDLRDREESVTPRGGTKGGASQVGKGAYVRVLPAHGYNQVPFFRGDVPQSSREEYDGELVGLRFNASAWRSLDGLLHEPLFDLANLEEP